MTKGRTALPTTVVAEQDPFFIALRGPKAHDSSGRKTFPGKVRWTADLSTPLLRSSGRDDKRGGRRFQRQLVARQDPFFIALGGPKAHDSSCRDDNSVQQLTVAGSAALPFCHLDRSSEGAICGF